MHPPRCFMRTCWCVFGCSCCCQLVLLVGRFLAAGRPRLQLWPTPPLPLCHILHLCWASWSSVRRTRSAAGASSIPWSIFWYSPPLFYLSWSIFLCLPRCSLKWKFTGPLEIFLNISASPWKTWCRVTEGPAHFTGGVQTSIKTEHKHQTEHEVNCHGYG